MIHINDTIGVGSIVYIKGQSNSAGKAVRVNSLMSNKVSAYDEILVSVTNIGGYVTSRYKLTVISPQLGDIMPFKVGDRVYIKGKQESMGVVQYIELNSNVELRDVYNMVHVATVNGIYSAHAHNLTLIPSKQSTREKPNMSSKDESTINPTTSMFYLVKELGGCYIGSYKATLVEAKDECAQLLRRNPKGKYAVLVSVELHQIAEPPIKITKY